MSYTLDDMMFDIQTRVPLEDIRGKIREDAIDEFKNAILSQFCAYCDQEACEGGCAGSIQQCYAAANLAEVINDIAEELKEQKEEENEQE